MAPFDTGDWSSCIKNGQKTNPAARWPPFPASAGKCPPRWWPPVVGTYDHLDHLLRINLATFGGCKWVKQVLQQQIRIIASAPGA